MKFGERELSHSWPLTIVACLLFSLLLSLGVWQLDRAREKLELQARHAASTIEQPLRVEDVSDVASVQFRRVTATGEFDGARQFLLDNRTHRGVAGYHVLTAFRLSAGRRGVLVNRGWVPVGESRDRPPRLPIRTGLTRIEGIASLPPRTFLLGPAGYERQAWPLVVQSIEIDRIEDRLGYPLLDGVLLMEPGDPDGFVRDWQAYPGIGPDRHRAYAFQWFSLAIALLVIYVVMTMRRPRGETGFNR